MNRQIRRAQEKQDKKADKEKERRRDARREKVDQARARRTRRREEAKRARAEGGSSGVSASGGNDAPVPAGKRTKKPGRFAGALMMATVFFIVLQSAAPPEDAGNELLRTITSAGFYLLFGYFSVLWLMRRGTPRPVMMTLISGAFLTIGVEVAKAFQPAVPTDPLMLALAIPGLVAGAFLGRLVYVNSPG